MLLNHDRTTRRPLLTLTFSRKEKKEDDSPPAGHVSSGPRYKGDERTVGLKSGIGTYLKDGNGTRRADGRYLLH